MKSNDEDGAYTSTAFMNYIKPVIGSKKFSAASLASSGAR